MRNDFQIGEWVDIKIDKSEFSGYISDDQTEKNGTRVWVYDKNEQKVNEFNVYDKYIRKAEIQTFDNWKEMLIDASLIMGDKDLFMELASTK